MCGVKGAGFIVPYLIVPALATFGVCLLLYNEAPFAGFLGIAGVLVHMALFRAESTEKQEGERGWRVGHVGRDGMYYEELRGEAWERIEIGGEMLVVEGHHVIYFRSTNFPEWTRGRRDEIIGRIKSEFRPPNYEYDEDPVGVAEER